MPESDLIAVRCQIAQSGPAGERVFRIKPADGEVYAGVAPQEYCYTPAGKLLPDDVPVRGKREPGLISARIIQEEGEDDFLIFGSRPGGCPGCQEGRDRKPPEGDFAQCFSPIVTFTRPLSAKS